MEFSVFVENELPALAKFAGVLTGNRQDAHDVLANALEVTARRWDRINVMDHPTAYVRRIVLTTFLSQQRTEAKRRTRVTADSAVFDRPTPDQTTSVHDRDAADRLIDQLPATQRAVVVLRFYLDLDHARIATALDMSTGAVRSALSRALASLRLTQDITEETP